MHAGAVRAVEVVFIVGWVAFWIYWIAAAFSTKRGHISWGREAGIRVVLVVLIVVFARVGAFRHHGANTTAWRAALGLMLFAVGLCFAVWARRHIGRNWGSPMSRKDDPDLVTSGPYRRVRHPIYSGILTAGIGTAVALSWVWLIAVVLAGT